MTSLIVVDILVVTVLTGQSWGGNVSAGQQDGTAGEGLEGGVAQGGPVQHLGVRGGSGASTGRSAGWWRWWR